jgi:hypothetical protein
VATISVTALALLSWTDTVSAGSGSRLMLTVAVILLAAGLLFRSWHRASPVARCIVGAGIALASLHMWLGGELDQLTLTDIAWQSWLPRIVGLSFGALLLLSLLAFMDARSTAGAAVWASLVLLWQVAHAGASILQAAWPRSSQTLDFSRIPTKTMLAWTSTPLLSALLAIAIAQLLAAGLASAAQRHNTTSMRPPPKDLKRLSPVPRIGHH